MRLTSRGQLVVAVLVVALVVVVGPSVLRVGTDGPEPGTRPAALGPAPLVAPRAPALLPAPAATQASVGPAGPPAQGSPPRPAGAVAPVDLPVVPQGTGRLAVVPGGTTPAGSGPLRRYRVEVEEGIEVDPATFAVAVDRTLADPRSWTAGGRASFARVDTAPAEFRVVLASPQTADRLCAPLITRGSYSCASGSTAVVNGMRWQRGAATYGDRLEDYRTYVVNHEVGHVLGRGHTGCPGAGLPAPAMMQQTKGVGACLPSPWPFPG